MAAVGDVIHSFAPHSALSIFACSLLVFIVAILITIYASRDPKTPSPTVEEVLRIGFAAGPIPIYILLPLAPFDPDLANAVLEQPFQLLLAAAAGAVWTVNDMKNIASRAGTTR